MPDVPITISERARMSLKVLADDLDQPVREVVDQAIEHLRAQSCPSTARTSVEVSEKADRMLAELAQQRDQPKQGVLEEAIRQYGRDRRIEQFVESARRLRADPEQWASYQQEVSEIFGAPAQSLEGRE